MSRMRVTAAQILADCPLVVGFGGWGVLGSELPATGEHGPSVGYQWIDLIADANKEIWVRITTEPSAGTLLMWPDSSFEYDGPSTTFEAQLAVDAADVGTPQMVTVTVGAGATYNDSISESTTLADTAATTNMLTALLAEAVSLLDQLNTGNGSLYTEVLTASVALSDALTSTATLTGAVTESMALSDALNALAAFQATLSEAVAAGDLVATQADQATLPRKVLTARITALSFSARVEAEALGARVQATSFSARLQ